MKYSHSQPIFYITRDIERAAGLLPPQPFLRKKGIGDCFVITNTSPLAEALEERYHKQIIMPPQGRDRSRPVATIELMRSPWVQKKIHDLSNDESSNILVFKTSPQIEQECAKNGWRLLNPPYEIGAVLEEKIGQWRWLSALRKAQSDNLILPQVWLGKTSERSYDNIISELGKAPIVQFNRGHTGLGTFRLKDEQQWNELQMKFPNREVKASRFYEGKAFTMNAVVFHCHHEPSRRVTGGMLRQAQHDTRVVIGNISEQLTGIPGCTNNPYATVGNDWSAGGQLQTEVRKNIHLCAEAVGKALAERGYCGMFGIDVIVTDKGDVILIELNPRQPASATMESQLQQERGEVSVMELHLNALQGVGEQKKEEGRRKKEIEGFQLFFRNTDTKPIILTRALAPCRNQLTDSGLHYLSEVASVTEIKNHEFFAFSVRANSPIPPGGEILRIQSKQGIVETLGPDYLNSIARLRTAMPQCQIA